MNGGSLSATHGSTISDDGTYVLNGKASVDYANGYLTNYLVSSHGKRNKYPAGTYMLTVRELGGTTVNAVIGTAVNAPSGTTYPGAKVGSTKVVLVEDSELSVFVQFRTNAGNGKGDGAADNYHISL